jgi:anti-sigma B factor antagonist
MSDDKMVQDPAAEDTIRFAELSGGVVVIRVTGRGSYANSVEFKSLADNVADRRGAGNYHFILDLDGCPTMDSTFMGVLASIGLRQKREGRDALIVVNANEQSTRLLKTLGLSHFISVRTMQQADIPRLSENSFQCADRTDLSKADRIAHMIEAHEKLCDIEHENNVRFESVLKYLNESLNRETNH